MREIFNANQKKKLVITKKLVKSDIYILKLLFQDNIILSYQKKREIFYTKARIFLALKIN